MAKLIEMPSSYRNRAVRRGFAVALALTVTLGAACSLDLSGIPAATDAGSTSGGGVGAGSTSVSAAGTGGAGGASATSSGVASSSVASSAMASSGTTSPCTPTGAEICNDGIDNDCNLATDCEDPACAVGFVCIPAIPSG